jgi:hypothetical protein
MSPRKSWTESISVSESKDISSRPCFSHRLVASDCVALSLGTTIFFPPTKFKTAVVFFVYLDSTLTTKMFTVFQRLQQEWFPLNLFLFDNSKIKHFYGVVVTPGGKAFSSQEKFIS